MFGNEMSRTKYQDPIFIQSQIQGFEGSGGFLISGQKMMDFFSQKKSKHFKIFLTLCTGSRIDSLNFQSNSPKIA